MLECKQFFRQYGYLVSIELIDTCWNVNERAEQAREALELELIDTCWNVNIRRKHAAISE